MGDFMSDNNRKRPRIDYKERVLCYKHIITSSNIKPDPAPIKIVIEDISYSGLGIVCNRDLGRGDFLIFNLESGGMVKEFMTEVRWCKYSDGLYEAGLQFTNLTKEMIIFLDGLIKSYQLGQARVRRRT